MRKGSILWGGLSLLALGCPPEEVDGTSTQVDPSTTGTMMPSTAPTDSTTQMPEDGSTTEPTGGSGTTDGTAGPSTGPGAECGNDQIEGDEICDGTDLGNRGCISQGFDGGTLACAEDCTQFDTRGCVVFTCGNGVIDGSDVCDGEDVGGQTCASLGVGFDGGTLVCDRDCETLDTSGCGTCGNVVVDGDEPCDGVALLGQTCEDEGFEYGQIACLDDCSGFDTTGCGLCGDGSVGGSEVCDGADLGGQTCASLGLIGGTLACTAACSYDFSMCDLPGIPFGTDVGYEGFALTPEVLACDDINATGIATGLGDDDSQEVPMGFAFPVYGVNQTNVTIQSNGTLRWGDDLYLSYVNSCLPTNTAPSTHVLYVFWDDLDPTLGAGEVYYQTLGVPGDQRFVVQWDTANYSGDPTDLMRFSVVLHEASGQIDVCYEDTINAGNMADHGAQATAGIQLNALNGFHFSCNTPDLVDGTQLMYVPI